MHTTTIHRDLYAPRWVSHDQSPTTLISPVLPGLWIGGTADTDTVDVPVRRAGFDTTIDFDAVVTLYAWAHPVPWHVAEYRYGFGDGPIRAADIPHLIDAARWAHRRWRAGDRVLIRCQAGLNRSGLITALVLILDGATPAAAIRHLRACRAPVVLVNDDFVDWLLTDAAWHVTGGRTDPTDTGVARNP